MTMRAYYVRPAIYAPAQLSIIFVIMAVRLSWWILASLPFICLGSVCAAPNCNLANGCLAYVALLKGLIVFPFFQPLRVAILAGIISGYVLYVIAKTIRLEPVADDKPMTRCRTRKMNTTCPS